MEAESGREMHEQACLLLVRVQDEARHAHDDRVAGREQCSLNLGVEGGGRGEEGERSLEGRGLHDLKKTDTRQPHLPAQQN